MTTRYLTVVETAKLLRRALKEAFPGAKFSVRCRPGGSSINVGYTDGPPTKAVESLAHRYQGADFDPTIDLQSGRDHWLLPDGSVQLAHAQGTTSSRGSISEVTNPKPEGAESVSFGANYVFVDRRASLGADALARRKAQLTLANDLRGEPQTRRVFAELDFTRISAQMQMSTLDDLENTPTEELEAASDCLTAVENGTHGQGVRHMPLPLRS